MYMNNLEYIGAKIREYRKRKKISQEVLAEMINMNTRSILRIENSQSFPSLETLEKIAKALEIKLSDFFEQKIYENKTEIINEINEIINNMEYEDLKKFYKAIYYYTH